MTTAPPCRSHGENSPRATATTTRAARARGGLCAQGGCHGYSLSPTSRFRKGCVSVIQQEVTKPGPVPSCVPPLPGKEVAMAWDR